MTQLCDFRAGQRVRIPTSNGVIVGKILRGGDAWWTIVEVMRGAGRTERMKLQAETPACLLRQAERDDER